MIAQASSDERGKYRGGTASDQTGRELNIRAWYSRPWDTVLRPKDALLGINIATVAETLCKCPKIGYDQSQRTTLWSECERIGWNINRINDIAPCECDCSSLIAVILHFCGVIISKDVWTGNLAAAVMATGKFETLRDKKYLTSDKYLKMGDIVLNSAHHVAVNLDDGDGRIVSYAAIVDVKTYLNVRTSPNGPMLKVNEHDFQLPPGMVVAICEEKEGWGRLSDISGWVSLSYLRRS